MKTAPFTSSNIPVQGGDPGDISSFYMLEFQVSTLFQVLPRCSERAEGQWPHDQQKGENSSRVFRRLSLPEYLHSCRLDKEQQAASKHGTRWSSPLCYSIQVFSGTGKGLRPLDTQVDKSGLGQGPRASFHPRKCKCFFLILVGLLYIWNV